MKSDLYTKSLLTIIAIMLTAIAYSRFLPPRVVYAKPAQPAIAGYPGVQFWSDGTATMAFDPVGGYLYRFSGSTTIPNSALPSLHDFTLTPTFMGKVSSLNSPIDMSPLQ